MWLSYDDGLSPESGFRGPAYFEDSLITLHQAQTDVEMFEKLENYLKSDPALIKKIEQSGIDVAKKRQDLLLALYVLAVKSFQDRAMEQAIGFLDRFDARMAIEPASSFENLRIAAANLRGLVFWAQGQRRPAEESLKKAFYSSRKNPVQRYVLRNIGLLMLSAKDRDTAAEMFRLAATMKHGYTLLDRESKLIKKN
jgi:tetratricopeptide (TPR) repeat protein